MKKNLIFCLIFFFNLNAHSSSNQKIINHLQNINSLQFKFTQNIKQCICCDDLFIRLVKPLREESSYKNNDDEDSQFIGYDGFY